MGKLPAHLLNAQRELSLLQHALGLKPRLEDVVIVCIDCEAYEHDHSKITEIGIAVLDTKDVQALEPGAKAEQCIAKIKAVHYRPIEYASLVNRKYVKGREEYFNFGPTTWISIADVPKVLRRVFSAPAHVHRAADLDEELPERLSSIMFVAHGLSNEKRFLRQLGIPSSSREEGDIFAKSVDTQIVAGGTKKKSPSLWRLLQALDIDPTDLHNAGNDAVLTLQALITMAGKDYEHPGSVFTALERTSESQPQSVVQTTRHAEHVYAGTLKRHNERERSSGKPVAGSRGDSRSRATSDGDSYMRTDELERKRPAEDMGAEAGPPSKRMTT